METQRTLLLPLIESDFQDVQELYSSTDVRRYLGGSISKDDFPEKFREMLQATTPEMYWTVRKKQNRSFVGLVSISKYHDQMNYEISYEFRKEYWGRGLGTEVIRAVLAYAFSSLGLAELYAETQSANLASIRLLEKVGFQFLMSLKRFGEQQALYSISKS
jgi:ribosomal-protein-alanine N-acetyltransferase